MGYIDTDKLIKFANNSKDKTIDANDIARFPNADVRENVMGEWINLMGHQVCSICGYKNDIVPTNFCPNCGAQMIRGEQDG